MHQTNHGADEEVHRDDSLADDQRGDAREGVGEGVEQDGHVAGLVSDPKVYSDPGFPSL